MLNILSGALLNASGHPVEHASSESERSATRRKWRKWRKWRKLSRSRITFWMLAVLGRFVGRSTVVSGSVVPLTAIASIFVSCRARMRPARAGACVEQSAPLGK